MKGMSGTDAEGVGKTKNESRLQRLGGFGAVEPRALPWADMNDALGVSQPPRPRQPTRLRQTARLCSHGEILVPDDFCAPPGDVRPWCISLTRAGDAGL